MTSSIKGQRSLAASLAMELKTLTGYELSAADVLDSLGCAGLALDVQQGDATSLAYFEEIGATK